MALKLRCNARSRVPYYLSPPRAPYPSFWVFMSFLVFFQRPVAAGEAWATKRNNRRRAAAAGWSSALTEEGRKEYTRGEKGKESRARRKKKQSRRGDGGRAHGGGMRRVTNAQSSRACSQLLTSLTLEFFHQVLIFLLQLIHLELQVSQVSLLATARTTRRLAVREHATNPEVVREHEKWTRKEEGGQLRAIREEHTHIFFYFPRKKAFREKRKKNTSIKNKKLSVFFNAAVAEPSPRLLCVWVSPSFVRRWRSESI